MPLEVSGPAALRGAARPLAAIVRRALASEARTLGDLTVVLATDRVLRTLNRTWRGIDRATDVLSFSYDEPTAPRRRQVGGDLVISLDRVAAQADRFRVRPGEELARLVIHGALHLAGLDHQRPAERRNMREREERALRASRAAAGELDRILSAAASRPPSRSRRSVVTRPAAKTRVTRKTRSG